MARTQRPSARECFGPDRARLRVNIVIMMLSPGVRVPRRLPPAARALFKLLIVAALAACCRCGRHGHGTTVANLSCLARAQQFKFKFLTSRFFISRRLLSLLYVLLVVSHVVTSRPSPSCPARARARAGPLNLKAAAPGQVWGTPSSGRVNHGMIARLAEVQLGTACVALCRQ